MPIIPRNIYQGPHGPTNDDGGGKSPLLYVAGAVVSSATAEKLGKLAKAEIIEPLAPLDAQKEFVKANAQAIVADAQATAKGEAKKS